MSLSCRIEEERGTSVVEIILLKFTREELSSKTPPDTGGDPASTSPFSHTRIFAQHDEEVCYKKNRIIDQYKMGKQ